MKKYIFIFWIFVVLPAYAQQANIWYFGNKAGIDFRQGKPVAIDDGQVHTFEGVAAISDKKGNLLFYTDGENVYNAQHKIMPNGIKLKGHSSSTQSAIIVPKNPFPNQYYIFTVTADGGEDGLCYSVVNMDLDNGLGDIVNDKKNIQLYTPVVEKITAIRHQNNKDIWLIAHEWKSNKFLVYLITEKGINTTPLIQEIGSPHLPRKDDYNGFLNTHGYMKSNSDGSNIALAIQGDDLVEVFDFDKKNGKITNQLQLKLPPQSQPYGIEFSPNGSLLYVAPVFSGKIYQYNLHSTNNVSSTRASIIPNNISELALGALQLAPDGKIYVSVQTTKYLNVIHQPNMVGVKCRYEHGYLKLNNATFLGLPNFNPSLFEPKLSSSITYFDKNKVKIGEKMVLRNVQFDYGLAELKPAYLADLNDLAEYMQKYPQTRLKLSGHTDNIGNKPSNIILSQNRVKAIKDYLAGKNIAETRISFEGFGSSVPLFTNDSEENRAKNRRVEIEIFEK